MATQTEAVQGTEFVKSDQPVELRRDVTVWGSYMWGYADVGADIYVALGLVIGASQGAAPLAFAMAGLVYIMIGLAYTELASTYPVAGGGHYYTLRGLGDFFGFVSGVALLLDYTIDVALFAVASAGYLNFFSPYLFPGAPNLRDLTVAIGPFAAVHWVWMLESLLMIAALIVLNIRGIRESSFVNEVLGGMDIVLEMSVVVFGFVLAWNPDLLVKQWVTQFPTLNQFMYGSSLAIISFVGLESISQAAQETRRPATIIPRTSIALIFTVFIFALGFSTVGLGILPWQDFKANEGDPIAFLAQHIPLLGILAGPFAGILGASILFISSNTGVMGSSRLAFSMSQLKLVTNWFDYISPKYHTPIRTILIFGGMGAIEALFGFLTPSALDTLGNIYAFGATLGYTLVFISLIKLRFDDPYSPRPYKVPGNLTIKWKGRDVEFPVIGVLGMLGVSLILFEVVLTHEIGRIAGPGWVILGIIYYLVYRKKNKLPVLGSLKHDWEKEQQEVLTKAEEFELLSQYKSALARRDKQFGFNGKGKPKSNVKT